MRLLHPAGAPGPGHVAAPQAPLLPGTLALAQSHTAAAEGVAEGPGHAAAPMQSSVAPSEQQLLMEGDGFKARCCPGCMWRHMCREATRCGLPVAADALGKVLVLVEHSCCKVCCAGLPKLLMSHFFHLISAIVNMTRLLATLRSSG